MKKRILNKSVYTILLILFFIILLGTNSLAIRAKTAVRIPYIITYNLEWCVYLLIPSILAFIVSLILKLKNNARNKKVVSVLLVISIICLVLIGIEFAIHHIGLKEIIYFIEFKN